VSNNDSRPEEMSQFFDARADSYDAHMRENIDAFEELYRVVAGPIRRSSGPVAVLDLGCGTGLELEPIFARVPRAVVTCVDSSKRMLAQLKKKHRSRAGQLRIVHQSYLSMDLEPSAYDYAVAVMTLHHLLHDTKRELYARVYEALRPGGLYIEADYMVSPEREEELLEAYSVQVDELGLHCDGSHHIDIPFSVSTQVALLAGAGFDEVEVIWRRAEAAVLLARRR
jgi:tRNA (cmo5U34)-methyltransferase